MNNETPTPRGTKRDPLSQSPNENNQQKIAKSKDLQEPTKHMKKKVKTHISKKEKKALDKMEAEEIAREEMSTFRTTI